MLTVRTQDLDLIHFTSPEDPSRECRANWALHREAGTAGTAVIYFELEPGKHLGRHTDSAEEILVVLAGSVEAVVGEECRRVDAGGLAVVPAQVPHDVRAVGNCPALVAGVFNSNSIVSVFDSEWLPIGSRVVTTPMPAEDGVEAAPVSAG